MTSSSHQVRSATLRIAVVARHYWPYINDSTLRLAQTAANLRSHGVQVVVLTPRWHGSWPNRVSVEEVEVVRLENPPTNQLRQSQYRRSLSDWLDKHGDSLSCVYCDEAGLDALTVLKHRKVVQRGLPVAVRHDPFDWTVSAEAELDRQPSQSVIDACSQSAITLVPRPSVQQSLLRFGVPARLLSVCSDWTVRSIDRSTIQCKDARRTLADINSDLNILNHHRLIVVPGELSRNWRLDPFIRAICPLLDTYSSLRVWLHGDGADREKLYELLQFFGHHRNVIMPGMITSASSLIQAADLCVFPSPTVGQSWFIPACLISGATCLIANSADLKWQLGHLSASLSYDSTSASELQSKLERWLNGPDELAAASRSAGQLIRRQFNQKSVADQLYQLASALSATLGVNKSTSSPR